MDEKTYGALKRIIDIIEKEKNKVGNVLLPAYLEDDFTDMSKLEVAQRSYTIGTINAQKDTMEHIIKILRELEV